MRPEDFEGTPLRVYSNGRSIPSSQTGVYEHNPIYSNLRLDDYGPWFAGYETVKSHFEFVTFSSARSTESRASSNWAIQNKPS